MSTTYQVPREFAHGGSYVDETLFGETRAKKTAARRRAGQTLVGGGQTQQQAMRLTRREYEEIKRRANTPLAVLEQTQNPENGESEATRRQHRVHIGMLHKEKPTPVQEYERQYRETVGTGGANIRAFQLRNEELDEVKELKSHLEVMHVKVRGEAGGGERGRGRRIPAHALRLMR